MSFVCIQREKVRGVPERDYQDMSHTYGVGIPFRVTEIVPYNNLVHWWITERTWFRR